MLKVESENDIKSNKIQEYEDYIEEHISNVKKAFEELVNKDIPETREYLNELQQKVNKHDVSKYSDEEFDAYRKNFYPVDDKEKEDNKEEFEKAWKHHYEHNNHHWQHWLDEETGNLISLQEFNLKEVKLAYLEMILDWQAMGYKFGDTAYEYYNNHKDEIKLYPELKSWIINIMKQLDKEED